MHAYASRACHTHLVQMTSAMLALSPYMHALRAAMYAMRPYTPCGRPPAQSDTKAMALFAYEISQILQERSLECSIASALSVLSCSQIGKCTQQAQCVGHEHNIEAPA